jgi:hypothetical protein
MTLEKAKQMLDETYERACRLDFVQDPLAFALYQVWKAAHEERSCNGSDSVH